MTATLVGVDELIHSPRHRRYLLRHTFSGAALTPSDLGPAFSTVSGTASVSGGVLTKVGATNLEVKATGVGASLVYQATLNFGASAGVNRRMLLRARQDGAGSNRFQLTLNRVANQIILARVDAGTPTTIGSVSFTVADSTNYVLQWRITGSRHEVLIATGAGPFASQFVVTDAAFAAQTTVGAFIIDDDASPTATIDDLLVWAA